MIKATIQNRPYCTEIRFPCTETELSKRLGEIGMNPEHLVPMATVIGIEPSELSALEDCDVSTIAGAVIMSKRNRETDYAAELERDYARWDELFTKGGSDPSWSDGVNLNLVRSQIIYDKQRLAEQESSLFGLPEVYYREIPPEVDNNYMARPDEIRQDARKAMAIIDADENLKFVREQSASLSEKQLKQWCIPAVINYADNLRRAIAADDLIIMRRYEHLDGYLESFESAAIKIRNPESTRRINDNLTVCDPEDDEEIGDDFDEECSETEQPVDEPEEDFQLRLF